MGRVIDFKKAIESHQREIDHVPSRVDLLVEERRRRPGLSLQDLEYLKCRGQWSEDLGTKVKCEVVDILSPVIDKWIQG